MIRSLILEREQQKQRAEAEILRQTKRADELHLENLRLQLERYIGSLFSKTKRLTKAITRSAMGCSPGIGNTTAVDITIGTPQ